MAELVGRYDISGVTPVETRDKERMRKCEDQLLRVIPKDFVEPLLSASRNENFASEQLEYNTNDGKLSILEPWMGSILLPGGKEDEEVKTLILNRFLSVWDNMLLVPQGHSLVMVAWGDKELFTQQMGRFLLDMESELAPFAQEKMISWKQLVGIAIGETIPPYTLHTESLPNGLGLIPEVNLSPEGTRAASAAKWIPNMMTAAMDSHIPLWQVSENKAIWEVEQQSKGLLIGGRLMEKNEILQATNMFPNENTWISELSEDDRKLLLGYEFNSYHTL